MVDLDHGQPDDAEKDDPATAARNSKIGLKLFAFYLVLYGSFVLINAFVPEWMDFNVWGGLNLAVLSGFGLIVAALIVSLIYGWLCRQPAANSADERKESQA